MNNKQRWVILKHFDSPERPNHFHFDLLLEEGPNCRSWRLEQMPELDGPSIAIIALPPHNLSWLETKGKKVSGDRGWASPVIAGFFYGDLPISQTCSFQIDLIGNGLSGRLKIFKNKCFLQSKNSFNT